MNHRSILRQTLGTSFATACLLGLGCARSATELVVQGTPAFTAVARPAVAAYQPGRPPGALLLTAGNAEGVRALLAGTCDIAALARELSPGEQQRARESGADLRVFRLGTVSVVPVVHRDNPLASLTVAQLRAIWAGTLRRWSEVGGPDLPIHVVTRAPGSALAELWDEKVMAGLPIRADATLTGMGAAGEPDPVLALVGGDPTAIGAMGAMGMSAGGMAPMVAAGVKSLAVGGITASEEALRSGRFPLASPLHLVLDGRTATDSVQGFVDFLLEPEGQRLVRRAGYLGV